MITYQATEYQFRADGTHMRIEGHCLSTDTKPTDKILNGSVLIEMDTGTVQFFDEAGTTWHEFGG